jgi:hypothetical protein
VPFVYVMTPASMSSIFASSLFTKNVRTRPPVAPSSLGN